MSNNLMKNIWLIGAGQMAVEYQTVLNDLNVNFKVIGRGEKSAKEFTEKTSVAPFVGGLKSFLSENPKQCTHAIVAVGVEKLAETTSQLLEYGIKNILVEKPAGLNKEEIGAVAKLAKEKKANVYVAYNRRFYASVLKAKKIITKDGGVISFNFEFTEWSHEIEKLEKAPGVKENWFLANSTHVVDLAFYLGGKPKEISSYVSGGLDWHPSASIFSGAGVSETGALFSYQANWESAGRWGVEMLTKEHRLIFRPMEKLQIQKRGSVKIDFVDDIDYALDEKYKPGLYLQTNNYFKSYFDNMINIQQLATIIKVYYKMGNYS
jgi:predicted dehydrogenase